MAALAVQILGLGLGLAGWRLSWVDIPVASPAGMVENGWQCAAAVSVVGTLGLVPGLLLLVEEGEVGVVEQVELVGKFLDLVSLRAVMEERWRRVFGDLLLLVEY